MGQTQYSRNKLAKGPRRSRRLEMRFIESLHENGAHFVLLKEPKRPAHTGWNRRRPNTAEIHDFLYRKRKHQDAGLGIVPFSLDSVVIDLDGGPVSNFMGDFPPALKVLTRPGRWHAWYGNRKAEIRNLTFGPEEKRSLHNNHSDVKGELRCKSGQVQIYNIDYLRELAQAADLGLFKHRQIPKQLLLFKDAVSNTDKSVKAELPPRTDNAITALLSTTLEGSRNNILFDVLRGWAYGRRRYYATEDEWASKVKSVALAFNDFFPDPLNRSEVINTALSVAGGVSSGITAYDHSSEAQAHRGRLSGAVRAGLIAGSNVDRRQEIKQRDKAILGAFHGKNQSYYSIAKEHGMSLEGVRKIIKRKAGYAAKVLGQGHTAESVNLMIEEHGSRVKYRRAQAAKQKEKTRRKPVETKSAKYRRNVRIRVEHHRTGASITELAAKYGVSRRTITRALNVPFEERNYWEQRMLLKAQNDGSKEVII